MKIKLATCGIMIDKKALIRNDIYRVRRKDMPICGSGTEKI